jgi:hypothetical protein
MTGQSTTFDNNSWRQGFVVCESCGHLKTTGKEPLK